MTVRKVAENPAADLLVDMHVFSVQNVWVLIVLERLAAGALVPTTGFMRKPDAEIVASYVL